MNPVYVALAYLGLFVGTAALLVFLRARSRQERAPFPDHLRLLRAPGESLRARLAVAEEALLDRFFLLIGLPAVAYGALLYLATTLREQHPYTATTLVFIGLLGLLTSFYVGVRQLVALIDLRRNLRLGYFGERVVAEHLEPLKAAGFRVFHDLPAGEPSGNASASRNLDHVVVGPTGIFALETKTRRKGRARVGFMAHEIIYDGHTLAYPWGEDRHGLEQAETQARWLAEFLENQLGRAVPVTPVLVFPGWTVLRKNRGLVHVLSPRELPDFVARPPAPPDFAGFVPPQPDAATLELIVRELEQRCRDVEL
ncbi:MAG: NERD domain-containing protein [Opitutaceae bacterium]|jgi:hypothetical protein|nr:NERD domain-containing protein [Opitutaceae bacterium]